MGGWKTHLTIEIFSQQCTICLRAHEAHIRQLSWPPRYLHVVCNNTKMTTMNSTTCIVWKYFASWKSVYESAISGGMHNADTSITVKNDTSCISQPSNHIFGPPHPAGWSYFQCPHVAHVCVSPVHRLRLGRHRTWVASCRRGRSRRRFRLSNDWSLSVVTFAIPPDRRLSARSGHFVFLRNILIRQVHWKHTLEIAQEAHCEALWYGMRCRGISQLRLVWFIPFVNKRMDVQVKTAWSVDNWRLQFLL